MEYRKELLANIPIFDGKDKKACLMWLSQCAHTAVNTKMTLKEVLVAKGRTNRIYPGTDFHE